MACSSLALASFSHLRLIAHSGEAEAEEAVEEEVHQLEGLADCGLEVELVGPD